MKLFGDANKGPLPFVAGQRLERRLGEGTVPEIKGVGYELTQKLVGVARGAGEGLIHFHHPIGG